MRSGSVSAAGQALRMPQPAVGRVLRTLESQFGRPLFERVGDRLLATAETQLILAGEQETAREIGVLVDLTARLPERRDRMLRVGASAPPALSILPGALAAFQARLPEVKLVVRSPSEAELRAQIRAGVIDLGLTFSPLPDPGLHSEPLAETPLMVVVAAASPLAGKSVLGAADLAGQTLISYALGAETEAQLDAAFARAGLTRRVAIEVPLASSAVPLVRAGLGVALADDLLPWSRHPDLAARPFDPGMAMKLSLVSAPGGPAARSVREFTQDLRAAMPRRSAA